MIRRLLLGCAGALLVASSAHAQEERLAGRLDARTHAAVTAQIDSARRAGLPVDPLVNKALEGASKNAPGPRIASAVASLVRQLGLARGVLGANAAPAELTAAAGALQAGARQRDLQLLRDSRGDASLLVPIGVLTDLVARGVSPDTAAAAVLLLALRGATDADFLTLRRDVERDIGAGAPPGAATTVRAQGGTAAPGVEPGRGLGKQGAPGQAGDNPGRGKGAAPPSQGGGNPGKGQGGLPPGKSGDAGGGKGPPAGQPPGKGDPPPGKGPRGKNP